MATSTTARENSSGQQTSFGASDDAAMETQDAVDTPSGSVHQCTTTAVQNEDTSESLQKGIDQPDVACHQPEQTTLKTPDPSSNSGLSAPHSFAAPTMSTSESTTSPIADMSFATSTASLLMKNPASNIPPEGEVTNRDEPLTSNTDNTDPSTSTASSLTLTLTESSLSKIPKSKIAQRGEMNEDEPSTSTKDETDLSTPAASSLMMKLASKTTPRGEATERDKPSTSKKDVFSIDTSLIPSIPNQMQAAELQGLEGVSVFDQEAFEKGVLEQVDQAITVRQQALDRERAEKDLNTVLTDIRSCKKELSHLDRLISLANAKSCTAPVTFAQKEMQRNVVSMRTKRENKAKQLKTLRARQRSLLAKLSGSDAGLQASDDEDDKQEGQDKNVQTYQQLLCRSPTYDGTPTIPQEETEQERLIRLGEMTPFGSTVQFKASTSKATSSPTKPSPQPLTDFEKFMAQKTEDDMTRRKKIVPRKKTPTKPKPETAKPKNAESKASVESAQDTEPRVRTHGKIEKAKLRKTPEMHKPKNLKKKKLKKTKHIEDSTDSESSIEEPYFVYKPVRSESSSFPRANKKKRKLSRDLRPHWGSDARLSDYWDGRDSAGSDEDYSPGFDDFSQPSDEAEEEPSPLKKVKRRGRRAKVSTEDFEDGTIASLDDLKRAYGVSVKRSSYAKSKCKDDATQDMYYRRLKEHRRSELLKKQRKIECGESESDSEPEDMQFEGGLTIPGKIWSKLYKYQKVGVKWLWELHLQQAGGIVGDEMGLGKTIQMIAFFAGLRASKLRNPGSKYIGLGPVLIVCPATVLHQWVKEYHKWLPEMRVAILHDSGAHTGSKRALIHDIALSHGTLITSYSGVRLQERLLLQHDWHYIVLDEGHKIRNPDAAVTQSCKQFRTCHRIILSGSPMQNNLRELWSLIDFVFPGKLGTLPVFMEKFSVPITIGGYSNATQIQVQTAYKCACVLRDTINPYLLRRLKADVKQNLQLPDKNEQVLFCRLTEDQIQLYKEYLNSKECQLILNKEYQIFAGLITLRKICNHPDLVSGGPRIIKGDTSAEAIEAAQDPTMQYGYWERSGKMIVVNSLLKLWHKQGHRVLLFSQSKQMLDIIEDFVKNVYTYLRIDGSTSISSRQPLIQQYNTDPSIFVFLLTTRVGGLGVNLTGANRVIIFDPDWNPSTDLQARERAWRIGQTRQVTIYRLITTGTIEEKVYHRQIFKQFLTNRILKDPRQRRFFKSNDLFELFTLGSDSSKHGTETSAIFAGIGSDVKVSTSRSSPARKRSVEKPRSERREESGIRKTPTDHKTQDDNKKEDIQDGDMENVTGSSRYLTNGIQAMPGPSHENGGTDLKNDQEGSRGESSKTSTLAAAPLPSSSVKNGTIRKTDKKKKKKKDARLEGHRIAHLSKHAVYRPKATDEEKSAQTDAQQDDYVLSKLLKKSGVHSALQHDNIMESGSPDYLLVEGEADRVARDAVQALRESRRHCRRATSGVPTWTGGQRNSTPPPKKPRFGQKTNSKVAGLHGSSKLSLNKDKKQQQKPVSAAAAPKPKHFSGTEFIEVAASKTSSKAATLPSSQSLLEQMRQRNAASASDPDSQSSVAGADLPQNELLQDIRDFVAFQAETDGQATTAEILQKFKAKLPANDSALFKSMLHSICTFHRVDGGGVWKLKGDFR